jgi:hypothetical protein
MEACGGGSNVTLRPFFSGWPLRPYQARIAGRTLVSLRSLWPGRSLFSLSPLWACGALLAPRTGRTGWPWHTLVALPALGTCWSLLPFWALLILTAGRQEQRRRKRNERDLLSHCRLPHSRKGSHPRGALSMKDASNQLIHTNFGRARKKGTSTTSPHTVASDIDSCEAPLLINVGTPPSGPEYPPSQSRTDFRYVASE